VQSSFWIYRHIPSSSTITSEHWDDSLPLNLDSAGFTSSYHVASLPMFDYDTSDKWSKVFTILNEADYLIMSSNRVWASVPRVPWKYPITSRFYQDLFDEKLNFTKVAEFNSYPGFQLPFLKSCYYLGPSDYPYLRRSNTWFSVDRECSYPGIYLRDDTAEEAFTVYDHPKVLIYQKTNEK
jgi:hypothetical protein